MVYVGKEELQILSPDAIKEAEALAVVENGRSIMDALEALGIKEATFKSGAYFRAGKKDRAIVREGLMIAETGTEYQLRFPKEGATSDELVVADEFKPTQKMRLLEGKAKLAYQKSEKRPKRLNPVDSLCRRNGLPCSMGKYFQVLFQSMVLST